MTERRIRRTDRRGNHYQVRRPMAVPYHEARCYTALQLLGDLIRITLVLLLLAAIFWLPALVQR